MHISYILNHLAESKTQPHYDDFLLSAVSIGHQPLPARGSRQLLKEVFPVAQLLSCCPGLGSARTALVPCSRTALCLRFSLFAHRE